MTTPTEFVLWLNGAAGVMGEAPTPEQWEAIKEKMGESLGFLAAKKLLERAEDQIVRDQWEIIREKMYPGGLVDAIKRPMLIGVGQNLLREPMGLYDPALSPKASCVSDKSDDRMDALAMAVNYAKEAK